MAIELGDKVLSIKQANQLLRERLEKARLVYGRIYLSGRMIWTEEFTENKLHGSDTNSAHLVCIEVRK